MKIKLLLIILIFFAAMAHGQTKLMTGPKHVIFVDVPKNWVQVSSKQLPLLLKPDVNVSVNTYMYIYTLDYNSSPDMDGWIKEDVVNFQTKHPGMEVDTMHLNLVNLKANGYQTGRYKTIVYNFEDEHKQVMLIIECKNTIATIVLSTNVGDEFNKYMLSFLDVARSAKVLARNAKIEKQ